MRLSRTDLLAVLTIVVGGVIGASLSLSPLVLWSPVDDVAEQVTADPQLRYPVVFDAVDVVGNIRLDDVTIIAMSGLYPDSAYTLADIPRAKESMFATGQFTDIRVRVDGDRGVVTLIWEVNEQERAEDAIDRAERIDEFGVEEPLVQGPYLIR